VSLRSKLAANIERARIAMTKLEEIFNDKSNHYNTAAGVGVVIKQLLDVYKNCRCLDKLLNTEFFAEANFEGLLDKVRERSKSSSTQQAVHDQLQRLFSTEDGQQQPPEASSRTVESSDELNQVSENFYYWKKKFFTILFLR
jgi:ubiquitin-conjugating enzyme E2 O